MPALPGGGRRVAHAHTRTQHFRPPRRFCSHLHDANLPVPRLCRVVTRCCYRARNGQGTWALRETLLRQARAEAASAREGRRRATDRRPCRTTARADTRPSEARRRRARPRLPAGPPHASGLWLRVLRPGRRPSAARPGAVRRRLRRAGCEPSAWVQRPALGGRTGKDGGSAAAAPGVQRLWGGGDAGTRWGPGPGSHSRSQMPVHSGRPGPNARNPGLPWIISRPFWRGVAGRRRPAPRCAVSARDPVASTAPAPPPRSAFAAPQGRPPPRCFAGAVCQPNPSSGLGRRAAARRVSGGRGLAGPICWLGEGAVRRERRSTRRRPSPGAPAAHLVLRSPGAAVGRLPPRCRGAQTALTAGDTRSTGR